MSIDLSMSSPDIDDRDVEAVLKVLRGRHLALGPNAEEFGRRFAAYVGARHGIAVSSGTAALHLIVKALGISPGDEVLVPSFTFAASVNVLLYEGATPVFVDIDPDTYNLAVSDVRSKITTRTTAIMVVDVFGHPADWDEIQSVAAEHGLKVIDDSCEAVGARYRGVPLGRFGAAAAFAFYPNKQMTTGEGGLLVTDDDAIAASARSLRNQGRGEMGAWVEHERLGYNYRMDEMSAALGLSQLARLDEILEKRERVAEMYNGKLSEFGWLSTPVVRAHVRMSWFVYVVRLADGLDRGPVMAGLEAEGIPVRGYFCPLHQMAYIRERLGGCEPELPVTESVATRTIALPFHNNLTEEQVDRVVQALQRVGKTIA